MAGTARFTPVGMTGARGCVRHQCSTMYPTHLQLAVQLTDSRADGGRGRGLQQLQRTGHQP